MSASARVALYGLGSMGMEVARRLSRVFQLQVADLNEEALLQAETELGAQRVRCPEDVAQTDFIVLCLPDPGISLQVLKEIGPHLKSGAVVIETSTVNPQDIALQAKLLAAHEIEMIDASLMAGVAQMKAGQAKLLIGGAPEVIGQCAPVLDALAEKQVVFGPLGSGAAAKVINNAVAHAVMVVVAEAGSLASANQVDLDKLIQLLSDPQMGIHRPLTYRLAERILNEDYQGGMPMDAACKDSMLALTLAQSSGVPLFAIQACHSVYEMAVAAGYARDDYAAIAKLWDGWGVPVVNDIQH